MSEHKPPAARLLETDAEVAELAATLAGEPLISVDTEADSFHSYFAKVCLVQISTRTADYIIDPLSASNLEPLASVLSDPAVICVLHGSDYDVRILDRDHGLRIGGLFDTMVAARILGYHSFGLASLLKHHFDLNVSKAAQRADWSRRPLTKDLLGYAAGDTHYLASLRDILHRELTAAGRLSWAEEDFTLLEQIRHEPREADPDAFRKIKGSRELDRRGLAVLSSLYQWRDLRARSLDRAPFRVMGNTTLIELSRRRPSRAQELSPIPGMPRNLPPATGQEILAAVQEALQLPEADLPPRKRPAREPRQEPDPALPRLKKFRDHLASEVSLDPGLVAPNALLESLCRARPETLEQMLEVPGIRTWQADLLGMKFLQTLHDR